MDYINSVLNEMLNGIDKAVNILNKKDSDNKKS